MRIFCPLKSAFSNAFDACSVSMLLVLCALGSGAQWRLGSRSVRGRSAALVGALKAQVMATPWPFDTAAAQFGSGRGTLDARNLSTNSGLSQPVRSHTRPWMADCASTGDACRRRGFSAAGSEGYEILLLEPIGLQEHLVFQICVFQRV